MSLIDDLELSVRAGNVLRALNPDMTMDDFLALTRQEITAQKNAGVRTWREVAEVQAHFRQLARENCKARSGGPAYLIPGTDTHDTWPGTSLRDAAALAALPAIITATSAGSHWPGLRGSLAEQPIEDRIAADAYRLADAFIAARETKEDDR